MKKAFLALLLLAAPAAQADVTVRSKVESGGFKGLGAFGGTVERSVQGLKSRETSDIDFKGAFMRAVTAARDGVQIVRVDLDRIWMLQPKKKVYTERTISQVRHETSPAAPSGAEKGKEEKPAEPTHRVRRTEFTVSKTGVKKDVNGFPAAENRILMLAEVEEIATKEATTYEFLTTVWTTPWSAELKTVAAEEAAFGQAFAKKLGVSLTPEERRLFDPATVAVMLGVSADKAEETIAQTKKKMSAIDGYPVLIDAAWYVREDAAAAVRRAAESKAAEPEDEGIDLSNGAAGAASSLLGGFAKKKMKENREKKAADREKLPAFSTYYELLSLNTAPVSEGLFDLPAGFKQKK